MLLTLYLALDHIPDRLWSQVLQARMFAYPDAARYRLGVNYQQLPTNAARSPVYCPFERDGRMNFTHNYGDDPNYVGSSPRPTVFASDTKGRGKVQSTITEHERWVGEVCSFASTMSDDDFVEPAAFWEVLGRQPGHQERFIDNVTGHLKGVKSPKLRNDVYGMLFGLFCLFSAPVARARISPAFD